MHRMCCIPFPSFGGDSFIAVISQWPDLSVDLQICSTTLRMHFPTAHADSKHKVSQRYKAFGKVSALPKHL